MKEILLIEAEPALMAFRIKTLEVEGYRVTGASTIQEAAKAIRQETYDLIIIDAGVREALALFPVTTLPTLIMVGKDDKAMCKPAACSYEKLQPTVSIREERRGDEIS